MLLLLKIVLAPIIALVLVCGIVLFVYSLGYFGGCLHARLSGKNRT